MLRLGLGQQQQGGSYHLHEATHLPAVPYHPPPFNPTPCSAAWGEPYGGDCDDTFHLSPDGNTLTQDTNMVQRTTGKRTQYK